MPFLGLVTLIRARIERFGPVSSFMGTWGALSRGVRRVYSRNVKILIFLGKPPTVVVFSWGGGGLRVAVSGQKSGHECSECLSSSGEVT